MQRPTLDTTLSSTDFRSFYWLKAELIDFCRTQGLSTHGAKLALIERIAAFLATGTRLAPEPPSRQRTTMPATFERSTIIAPGWRCTQALRAFFIQAIGPQFHFDQRMRDFIANNVGQTLDAAIAAWHAPRDTNEIAPQFEYNRFVRAYRQQYPAARHADVVAAWNTQRAGRRTAPDAPYSVPEAPATPTQRE